MLVAATDDLGNRCKGRNKHPNPRRVITLLINTDGLALRPKFKPTTRGLAIGGSKLPWTVESDRYVSRGGPVASCLIKLDSDEEMTLIWDRVPTCCDLRDVLRLVILLSTTIYHSSPT
jgi:hypothetical protein